jgi:hypothetical protein
MLQLDQPSTHHAATWSAELVQARLVEAYEIERKLPAEKLPRVRSASTVWPTMSREFADMVGWSDEARQAVWADWARAKGAHPFEVSRMWEALLWLQLLADHPGEQRCLVAWAKVKAGRGSIRKMVKRRPGWTRNTLYRRRDEGAARIAARLNSEGVAVR